jgi:hypothetical protein
LKSGRETVLRNPDHVTIAVADGPGAIEFFALLGFRKDHVATIDGGEPARYMGMPTMKAQHITLVLDGVEPHFEIHCSCSSRCPGRTPASTPRTCGGAATTISPSASTTSRRSVPTSSPTA